MNTFVDYFATNRFLKLVGAGGGVFRFVVKDVKHAFTCRPGALQHLVEAMQSGDRIVKEHEIKKKSDKLAGGDFFAHNGQAAEPQHANGAHRGEKTHDRVVICPGAHDPQGALAQILGTVGKTDVLMVLPAVCLDLADALEVIHQQGIHGAGGLALFAVATMGGKGVPERANGEQRNGRQGDGGKEGVSDEQDCSDAADGEDGDGTLLGTVNQHALDVIDILNDSRH